MTQIIFYSTAPLQVENTLFTLIEKSLEKGYKSLLLFIDKEKCLSIDENYGLINRILSCLIYQKMKKFL